MKLIYFQTFLRVDFIFETAFHYVGLSLLEHTIMIRMASNSQISNFLYLGFSNPGVKGSPHFAQLINTFYFKKL